LENPINLSGFERTTFWYSIVPQPTTLPRAPSNYGSYSFHIRINQNSYEFLHMRRYSTAKVHQVLDWEHALLFIPVSLHGRYRMTVSLV
jgi:hypothetical protein